MQENLVPAAPNVILNFLQIQLCKILYCLRSLNDAKPASQAKQGSTLAPSITKVAPSNRKPHQNAITTCTRLQRNLIKKRLQHIHQEFKDSISSVRLL
jgi:hypothetical protein